MIRPLAISRVFSFAIATSMLVLTMHQSCLAQMPIYCSPLTYDEVADDGYPGGSVGKYHNGTVTDAVYDVQQGTDLGRRVTQWDLDGNVEFFDRLGTDANGVGNADPWTVGSSGIIAGRSKKYFNDVDAGWRAVIWQPGNPTPLELQNLGEDPSGYADSVAQIVSAQNVILGNAEKYDVNGNLLGRRAVIWNAQGNATELALLSTGLSGEAQTGAFSFGPNGQLPGYADKYDAVGTDLGYRPLVWSPDGSTFTQLSTWAPNDDIKHFGQAEFMNSSGVIVGSATRFENGVSLHDLAHVRWDAKGNLAELGNLGVDSDGRWGDWVIGINDDGSIFGTLATYDSNHVFKGLRCVRWDVDTLQAIEMNTDVDASQYGKSGANDFNQQGTIFGSMFIQGESVASSDTRAVVWVANGNYVNLNDLATHNDPGTWTLRELRRLEDDGWVTGWGRYDPDGPGPLNEYSRVWLAQVGLGGTWTNRGGGTWGTGNNWSTGTPAMAIGQATFDLNSNYTVTLDRDEATQAIDLLAGQVILAGNGFSLATTTDDFVVADGAQLTGEFDFDGDGQTPTSLRIAGKLSPGSSAGLITVHGGLVFETTGQLIIELGGKLPTEFDRLDVIGSATLDGVLSVSRINGFTLSAGAQFPIMQVAGNVGGHFTGLPEGALVGNYGGTDLFITYTGGDGNDVVLYTAVEPTEPFGRKLLDGVEFGGQLTDVVESDDIYYELDPSPTNNPVKQKVEMILLSESPTATPSSFSFVLEAAMSGGPSGDVTQVIELWNEQSSSWDVYDFRAASNTDLSIQVDATGKLSDYVHPLTDEVTAKVTWFVPEFSGSPFTWSIDIDQAVWLVQ